MESGRLGCWDLPAGHSGLSPPICSSWASWVAACHRLGEGLSPAHVSAARRLPEHDANRSHKFKLSRSRPANMDSGRLGCWDLPAGHAGLSPPICSRRMPMLLQCVRLLQQQGPVHTQQEAQGSLSADGEQSVHKDVH